MNLPEDVLAFIEASFAPGQRAEALSLLQQARIEDGTEPSARLLRCAAVGSRGSLPQLHYLASLLAVDWRDVIMAGEYELRDGTAVCVRDLEKPLPTQAPR